MKYSLNDLIIVTVGNNAGKMGHVIDVITYNDGPQDILINLGTTIDLIDDSECRLATEDEIKWELIRRIKESGDEGNV